MTLDLGRLRRLITAHGPVARVLVVEARGSVPRGAGTSMVVWDGGFDGTIGGGALEWRALAVARDVLRSGEQVVLRIPLGPDLGQCCGGAVTLVLERLDELPPAPWVRRVKGTAEAPEMTGFAFRDGWVREEEMRAARDVWIWGAGHVGASLAEVLRPMPDLAVTAIDDAQTRFPDLSDGITQLLAADMPHAMTHAPPHAEHIIATYSHEIDLALCHAALTRGFRFCGLIGSKTKWRRFQSRLMALGHEKQAIERIICPIGDPSLGKHPQAIAVGVAASLLSRQLSSGTTRETTA